MVVETVRDWNNNKKRYSLIQVGMSSTTSKPDFPYAIESLPEEENAQIKKDFRGYLTGGVRVAPKGYFFPGIYQDYASSYYNFQLHPTDVFVASYPKSGGGHIYLCTVQNNDNNNNITRVQYLELNG